jgi:NADPH2 dehydrogenase
MSGACYLHLGSLRDVATFKQYLRQQRIDIPCDDRVVAGSDSPLAQPLRLNGMTIGNRFAIHPMEGWDATLDGRPSELTIRRWQNFGRSGAKLIWGGEAVAVLPEGRANPNQLLINEQTRDDLARLRERLIAEHRQTTGSTDDLLIGLQLTHSGRYSRPDASGRPRPRILYHHPILDQRLGLPADYPLLTDSEIRAIILAFQRAAQMAWQSGFDFVDVKHCHGYLGHEFLSAHVRDGDYGGSFENRTRFLKEVVEGIRASAPGLEIGVRLSAFDTVPYQAHPASSAPGKPGAGAAEAFADRLPYRWGFGVNQDNPVEFDLTEPRRFLALLEEMGIRLVNLSAGSPYYNPHIQRPALFPPSDGYRPPEDPLVGVARQMAATRALKEQFPNLLFVGSGYTYLQDFLPQVAQAAVRDGWTDSVGLGRMVLAYPELPWHVLQGRTLERKRICRTFSDCTTAPRNGLPSGCYPLDGHYKNSETADQLKQLKHRHRRNSTEA